MPALSVSFVQLHKLPPSFVTHFEPHNHSHLASRKLGASSLFFNLKISALFVAVETIISQLSLSHEIADSTIDTTQKEKTSGDPLLQRETLTNTTRQMQAFTRRRTMWLLAAVLVMTRLPSTLSYKVNIPKVARSHVFSRTRLSEARKEGANEDFEETYALRRIPKKRSSASKVRMTSTVIDHSTMPSPFERRMRDMVLTNDNKKKTRQTPSNMPNNVKMVTSLQEYKKVVGEETDKLVVARFYAPWCKVCT
jgi:thiol-disulfide isomerase/thioredoxin